jgi:hypothetical protein
MKNHSETLFTRALMLTVAAGFAACGPETPPPSNEAQTPAALRDQAALTSRAFRPVKIDLARAETLGRLAAVHPELTRPLIQRIRTTHTQLCAGERMMVDAETNGEPGVEVRVQGQRGMPALVAFHATGERQVRVVARQKKDGKLVAIDRQEVPVTVVDCPNAPLVDLVTQPGETADTVAVRVTRVQGLAGGERVEEALLNGLRYRYDFGDGAVVVSDHPTASHRYALTGLRRATTYVQVTAIDGAGKEAVGRRAHDALSEPDATQAPKLAAATAEAPEVIGARMRAHQEAMENNPWLEATIEKARAQANTTP